MREFTTALTSGTSEEPAVAKAVTVVIDGREVTFLGPNTEELTLLMTAVSDTGTLDSAVSTSLNIIFDLIEKPEDARWFKGRLLDRRDPLNIATVTDIVVYLIEEWFARPTESQSDSSDSPPSTGQRSTGKRRHGASSHSRSARTAS